MVMTQPETNRSYLPAWLFFGGLILAAFGGVVGGELGPLIASIGLLSAAIGAFLVVTRALNARETQS